MAKKQHDKPNSTTDKERDDSKHQPKTGVIDGVGGMGGSSGAGGLRAKPDHVGDISGIDPDLDSGDVPMPGSTGKAGPSNARAGHSEGGMSGKNRGSDSETEPSRSAGEANQ